MSKWRKWGEEHLGDWFKDREAVNDPAEPIQRISQTNNWRTYFSIQDCPQFWCHLQVQEIPEAMLSFDWYSRRTHRTLSKLSCTWLLFITGKGYRIILAEGRDWQVRVWEDYTHEASLGFITFLELVFDSAHRVLPTRGAHLSFRVQIFTNVSPCKVWLTTHVVIPHYKYNNSPPGPLTQSFDPESQG